MWLQKWGGGKKATKSRFSLLRNLGQFLLVLSRGSAYPTTASSFESNGNIPADRAVQSTVSGARDSPEFMTT